MQIEDGAGTGFKALVNTTNQLAVTAISSSVEHHVNHHDGQAYSALFAQAATAADDCVFYLENTSEIDMVLEGINISVSGTTDVYFQAGNEGTRPTATDVTPANLNLGSGRTATGVFEVGADLQGGGTLATSTEIERYKFIGATATDHFNFPQDLIVPKGSTFTIWMSVQSITLTTTLYFNYHAISLG